MSYVFRRLYGAQSALLVSARRSQKVPCLPFLIEACSLSSSRRPGRIIRRPEAGSGQLVSRTPPPPAPLPTDDPWQEVKTKDGIYYWNTETNETTALGEPKPVGMSAGVSQQSSPGLGSIMAEGMAFGVGSAIAHRAVGAMASSLFGADDGVDDGGGDGSFDL